MESSKKPLNPGIPVHLAGAIDKEFHHDEMAFHLFAEFFEHRAYNRQFAFELIRAARSGRNSWGSRRIAILMLEYQILRMPASDLGELDLLLVELRLKPRAGIE